MKYFFFSLVLLVEGTIKHPSGKGEKMNKTLIIGAAVAVTLLSTGVVFAKTSLGSVKTPSGTEVAKVGIAGTVESVSTTGKNQIQVKDADGASYTVNLGKRGYVDTTVAAGDSIKVEGLEKDAGTVSAWNLTKADGSQVTIRTEAGKPAWAGTGGGNGGSGMHNGSGEGAGFVDANGDGVCDNEAK